MVARDTPTARWKAQPVESPSGELFGVLTAKPVKSCCRRRTACMGHKLKRVKSGAPYEPGEQKCESGIAIQPVDPHTARELRARRSGL